MSSRSKSVNITHLLETNQHDKIALTKARKHDGNISLTCPSCGKDTTIPQYAFSGTATVLDPKDERAKHGITQTSYRIRVRSWPRIILLGLIVPLIIIPIGAGGTIWGWDYLVAFLASIYLFLGIGLFILIGLVIYLICAIPWTYILTRKKPVWKVSCSHGKHHLYVTTDNTFWFNAYVLTLKTD